MQKKQGVQFGITAQSFR